MAFNITDRSLQAMLERNLANAQRETTDSLERLSSGSAFAHGKPMPTERALAEGFEFKLRSLSASKRGINTAVSMLQTAEGSLSEITNMVLRMKEINTAAVNTTISDRDRSFLFVEYQALHDEVNRIAAVTEFNGVPLLDGDSDKSPEALVFRVGDPFISKAEGSEGDDLNMLKFDGFKQVIATIEGLGLKSAQPLLAELSDEEGSGISLEDAVELMTLEDSEHFSNVYDHALDKISTHRATFGALQVRLDRASDFIDVYHENLTAAKSAIADVDYAKEVSQLVQSRLRVQAGTAALAQGNINAHQALSLLSSVGIN